MIDMSPPVRPELGVYELLRPARHGIIETPGECRLGWIVAESGRIVDIPDIDVDRLAPVAEFNAAIRNDLARKDARFHTSQADARAALPEAQRRANQEYEHCLTLYRDWLASQPAWRIMRNGRFYGRREALGDARALIRRVQLVAGYGDRWAILDANNNDVGLE